jgi:uncharacterized phage-associated protein
MLPSYDEKKSVQLAGRLLTLRGGQMDRINLMKLMYIADREALTRWGNPITLDRYCSMDSGPVLSNTYDLIKANGINKTVWSDYIENGKFHEVKLKKATGDSYLSQAECDLIDEVFEQYGSQEQWELVELTHTFQEWKHPNGSSVPIAYEEILTAKNVSKERQEIILDDLAAVAQLTATLKEFA